MKHQERLKIAIKRYEKSLVKNGTMPMGVSLAISSGLTFLIYYRTAHKKDEYINRTGKKSA